MIHYNLICGDCLEEMRKMKNNSVDVIITSPPYNDSGYTENDKENKWHFKYENAENIDNYFEWQCDCIDEMLRITKRHIRDFIGCEIYKPYFDIASQRMADENSQITLFDYLKEAKNEDT